MQLMATLLNSTVLDGLQLHDFKYIYVEITPTFSLLCFPLVNPKILEPSSY